MSRFCTPASPAPGPGDLLQKTVTMMSGSSICAPWNGTFPLIWTANPDVIELPIIDELDINGWDLRKALRLFQKSNPPLFEWLSSPIIYKEKTDVIQRLRDLAPTSYSPVSCKYHYYKMAKGNFREYLKGNQVKLKKYLYVLRPVLAVLYLEKGLGPVPMQFSLLVDAVVTDPALLNSIKTLLARKAAADELGLGPRDPVLSRFLESRLERMSKQGFEKQKQQCPVGVLNRLFFETVKNHNQERKACHEK